MDVTGTQLLEKDIENLARGEAGAGLGVRAGGRGTPPASPRGSGYLCFVQE